MHNDKRATAIIEDTALKKISRRAVLKLGAASALALGALKLDIAEGAEGAPLKGKMDALKWGNKDVSPTTRKVRKAVPSACWQCVTRDGIVGFLEDGILKKIEGNPKLPRTGGVLCAKGQAGVNQLYDPDRILYPMKRVGPRGSGKWKRISWDEAKKEIVTKMKKLKDEGRPSTSCFTTGE